MGNSNSNYSITTYLLPHLWKQDEPDAYAPYQYDPLFGFEEQPRQEKIIPVSELEMDSANLEAQVRDFCAGARIQWRGCIKSYAPFWYKCKGLYNELSDCYYEERMHDMKEFERERRLNARERRLREKASA